MYKRQPEDVTVDVIRREMKRKKMSSKQREHAPLIWSRITGKAIPQLSAEAEEKLRLQFLQMQAPFNVHSPNTRKNFASYPVVLHRLLILNGYWDLLPCVTLLTCKAKNNAQDVIIKKIFQDLHWEFRSSPPTPPDTPVPMD